MDRRTLLKSLAAAVAGLTVSAHHKPWHEKGPKTTTTTSTTTSTTAPTTTSTSIAPTTTTTRPPPLDRDPTYADRTVVINPGDRWADKIDGA